MQNVLKKYIIVIPLEYLYGVVSISFSYDNTFSNFKFVWTAFHLQISILI